MPSEYFLFASESVSEGHPDKVCDQISDTILDAILSQDNLAKVAIDAAIKNQTILLLGEATHKAKGIDYVELAREAVRRIGYNHPDIGFDCNTCNIITEIGEQSPDIAAAVNKDPDGVEVGAGDQGQMFGYATDETPECMPLTALLSHRLVQKLDELRHNGHMPWLRPDGKSQVIILYKTENGATVPQYVHSVTLSAQHSPAIKLEDLREQIRENIIKKVIPADLLNEGTKYNINSCGQFILGGPIADSGLTGRKIVVDSYGGWGSHGGGAFSGKDPTKTDRSAAYAARWVAKSLVKAGLCRRCKVQLTYAIGLEEPQSVLVDSYGTGVKSDKEILAIVKENFDLHPSAIIKQMRLREPMYRKTSVYGHFGRDMFPWEVPKTLKY
ncbi:putative S-adenosylmethionine synthase 4, partial [Fragariocoptes setiger]